MESLLKSRFGWSDEQLRAHKRKLIGTKIVIAGQERLAKLVPVTGPSPGEEYPPGSGVFQIKVIRPLPFRVKANVPQGQRWLGDFS
jgi:hypothetical protein